MENTDDVPKDPVLGISQLVLLQALAQDVSKCSAKLREKRDQIERLRTEEAQFAQV